MIKEFYKPVSVEEAVSIKQENRGSIYYSGGTDINYPPSEVAAENVIGLENLGLSAVEMQGDNLVMGATATIQEMLDSPAVFPSLKEAASFIYSRNIRNMATIGGNIGAKRRDSALIPCLIALSAGVETSEEGLLPVEEYVIGEHDSLILAVHIPVPAGTCRVKKLSRSVSSTPILQAAVYIAGTWGDVNEAVIAVGGVVPKAARLTGIEAALKSGEISDSDDLAKGVADAITPESDLHGTAEYKKYITGVAVAGCVNDCMGRG